MRRSGVVVLLALLAFLGMLAPPAQAQAPAPKVTLGGTFEVINSAHWNLSQVDVDMTRARDSIWSTRQRTVLVALGEVDKARGVLAFELDAGWGMTGPGTSATVPGAAPQLAFSTGNAFGASNDLLNVIEIKQMYVDFPMPLVPWPTTVRLGGQPGAGTTSYKPVVYFDDFAGVYLATTFTPAVKLHLLYAKHDEDGFGCPKRNTAGARDIGACGSLGVALSSIAVSGAVTPIRTSFQRGDDFVLGVSLDTTPMKGLDVRPFWLYWLQKGVFNNGQNTALPTSGIGGIATNTTAFGSDQAKRELHYVGLDSRWRSGPFSFDPTVIWLWGQNDLSCAGVAAKAGTCGQAGGSTTGIDVNAWMVDLRGGWRTGPLLLEGFFLYASGNDARDNLGNTAGPLSTQSYFHPINTGGGYGAGWSNFIGSNSIDYIRSYAVGTSLSRGSFISYDRYGAITGSFRPSYALTNALTLQGLVAGHWTAQEVDTHGVFTAAAGWTPETQGSRRGGDHNFLGWELASNLIWAFAPGLNFDAMVGHLFAGDALNQCKTALSVAGTATGTCAAGSRDARDATSVAARVRFSF